MITDYGEFIEVIRPRKNPETKTWEITLDYDTKIPLYAGKGCWHLPHNGARFYGMILHEEPYKTREEMVMELLFMPIPHTHQAQGVKATLYISAKQTIES